VKLLAAVEIPQSAITRAVRGKQSATVGENHCGVDGQAVSGEVRSTRRVARSCSLTVPAMSPETKIVPSESSSDS